MTDRSTIDQEAAEIRPADTRDFRAGGKRLACKGGKGRILKQGTRPPPAEGCSPARARGRRFSVFDEEDTMERDTIHILVSFDAHYIPPFRTMLRSLTLNNPGETIHIWLLHSGLTGEELQDLEASCGAQGASFTPLELDRAIFRDAPVSRQYPQEMYYRLLAAQLLPPSLDRILYLDPDILVINPLRPLWETDLHTAAFAAAAHSWGPDVINDVNRYRLDTQHNYYNTGVLLMDLPRAREIVKPDRIFAYVREHGEELLLPDQDVFNALYGAQTVEVDDRLWNYDVRYFAAYLVKSENVCDTGWVMANTAILHFCGKSKPWKKGYAKRFGVLYKHYMNLAERLMNQPL